MKQKVAVVVPTCRPERIQSWQDAWQAEFESVHARLYVINDTQQTWDEMPSCFSRRTDGIRCYGFLKALHDGADIIITLDDDVTPLAGAVLKQHAIRLSGSLEQLAWDQLVPFRTRGRPYRSLQRLLPCVISHGLWLGTPDLDAATQLCEPNLSLSSSWQMDRVLNAGCYAPLSAMNLAFTRQIAPAFFFPPQGEGQPFDRFGDIWAGIIAKRICDHLQLGVHSGSPFVQHSRASDPFINLIKEAPGVLENEAFWQHIDAIQLQATTVAGCCRQIADCLSKIGGYYTELASRMHCWLDLLPADLK